MKYAAVKGLFLFSITQKNLTDFLYDHDDALYNALCNATALRKIKNKKLYT